VLLNLIKSILSMTMLITLFSQISTCEITKFYELKEDPLQSLKSKTDLELLQNTKSKIRNGI
jgi:hypothetical protein